jgi:hypothetical protein
LDAYIDYYEGDDFDLHLKPGSENIIERPCEAFRFTPRRRIGRKEGGVLYLAGVL